MSKLSLALTLLLFLACAPSPAPMTAVEVPASAVVSAPSASAPPTSVAPPPPQSKTCDNDTSEPFDCGTLQLGQCSAAQVYACPQAAKLPEGMGFRAKVARQVATCLARPDFAGTDITRCIKQTEACVRDAVAASCIDADAQSTCERELGSCGRDLQTLCAKLLSALEPKTRVSALSDMRSQRKSKSCNFSWDLNGFPFCPYCPFR